MGWGNNTPFSSKTVYIVVDKEIEGRVIKMCEDMGYKVLIPKNNGEGFGDHLKSLENSEVIIAQSNLEKACWISGYAFARGKVVIGKIEGNPDKLILESSYPTYNLKDLELVLYALSPKKQRLEIGKNKE